MSGTTNTNQLMDTEPGGENTQYESQKTFTAPPSNSSESPISQFRDPSTGTVHLPTHRKFHPHQTQTQNQTENQSASQNREYEEKGKEERQGEGGVSKERGEKTAENIRFGEAISEHGFGGETVGNGGGEGVGKEGEGDGDARGKMGYGGGSGVGA